MIFFDNASTTKVDKGCLKIIEKYCFESFYNPSALYHSSIKVSNDIKKARESLMQMTKCDGELVFTASGTESNNLALLSCKKRKGSRIIVSESEHPSIINTALELRERGFDLQIVKVDSCGRVDFEDYQNLVNENTSLISIMHINNETGGINDIKKLCNYAKGIKKNIIFHSDGVQSFGKIDVDMRSLGIDLYSASSHKVHSTKGCGALFIKKGTHIQPLIYGGGQEKNMRSSTENVAGIMCFAYSSGKTLRNLNETQNTVQKLKDYICNNLVDSNIITISDNKCSPFIISLALKNVRGEVMLHSLEKYGIMIATGSACSSAKKDKGLWRKRHLPREYQNGIIRLSFSDENTIEEAQYFINKLNLEYFELSKYIKG